ncbi:hypothetical protein RFI_37008, partial [Reticulomyxa filosa]
MSIEVFSGWKIHVPSTVLPKADEDLKIDPSAPTVNVVTDKSNEGVAKVLNQFVEITLDMVGVNHRSNISINDSSLCCLGEASIVDHKEMESMKEKSSNDELIVEEDDNEDDEDDDDEDDNDEDDENEEKDIFNQKINFGDLTKLLLEEEKNNLLSRGFLQREDVQHSLLDALKCRIELKTFTKLDLGQKPKVQISCSDLITFLLEISDVITHKRILGPAVEQLIPIPIIYNMIEIGRQQNIHCFTRDIFKLASHAKMLSDGISQTEISRNRPLVMFVGSDKCKGKSTLLMQLFEEQPFNVGAQQVKNTLHSSCVDLIFLGEKHKCNYHVIDVHGKLNDPFFLHCTNNKISKIDAIVRLAKFCHCIVLQ